MADRKSSVRANCLARFASPLTYHRERPPHRRPPPGRRAARPVARSYRTGPALEGLEDVAGALAHRRHVRVRAARTGPGRSQVFSIDTPPPTVSGSLHVGHVFSYTHTDLVARYQRMTGKHVFYPIGWDDNGLPTERRVQNYYGVRCDPTRRRTTRTSHPPAKPDAKDQVPISRRNFVDLCHELTHVDEQAFEDAVAPGRAERGLVAASTRPSPTTPRPWRRRRSCATCARGEAYLSEAPTLWDVTFQTAVAQAELEARDYPGAYHRVAFHAPRRAPVVHRDHPPRADRGLRGPGRAPRRRALPPTCSGRRSPRRCSGWRCRCSRTRPPSPTRAPGIAMCCTFGDLTDVHLVARAAAADPRDHRPGRADPARAARLARHGRGGRGLGRDRRQDDLLAPARPWSPCCASPATSTGEPTPTQRKANFYEKGDKPLEIVSTRQWYIRNGGRDPELKAGDAARAARSSPGCRST